MYVCMYVNNNRCSAVADSKFVYLSPYNISGEFNLFIVNVLRSTSGKRSIKCSLKMFMSVNFFKLSRNFLLDSTAYSSLTNASRFQKTSTTHFSGQSSLFMASWVPNDQSSMCPGSVCSDLGAIIQIIIFTYLFTYLLTSAHDSKRYVACCYCYVLHRTLWRSLKCVFAL